VVTMKGTIFSVVTQVVSEHMPPASGLCGLLFDLRDGGGTYVRDRQTASWLQKQHFHIHRDVHGLIILTEIFHGFLESVQVIFLSPSAKELLYQFEIVPSHFCLIFHS
jgi:hypothetical protein